MCFRQELRALTKLKDKETNLRQTQDTLIVQLRTELSEAHQQVSCICMYVYMYILMMGGYDDRKAYDTSSLSVI